MPAVRIIGNLNIRVLTQLRLELFRVQLLLYNCTGSSALAAVQAWPQYCVLPAVRAAPLYSIIYILFFFVHVRSTSQRGSLIASFYLQQGK